MMYEAWTSNGSTTRRTSPSTPTKCYDVESLQESGPSPRSQTLLRQLESLVGRVVENKLEQVLHSGKDETQGPEVQSGGFGMCTQTEFATCQSRMSQTDQLDCLAKTPTKWLTPSEPQAAKDPRQPCRNPSSASAGERNLRGTADTLKQKLRARDSQVQNLSSQLKDTRQKLWQQMKDHKAQVAHVQKKMQEDPNANEALILLNYQICALSEKLNAENMRASKWAMIAKQQRLFLLQSESLNCDEDQDVLKRHAAGIVFTAPPCLPGEDDYGTVWDVASGGGANPYVVDSWPMEPNALAQRYAQSVPFGENIAEDSEGSESDCMSDREDRHVDKNAWIDRAKPGLRLPSLPAEGNQWTSRSDHSARSC